jgi:outer membrane biosynthesis protein TonB
MVDQNVLSQKVDEKVRMMIGELTMQTIVLRTLLDMQTEAQPTNQPQQPNPPSPNPKPQPIPPENPTPPRTPQSPPDKPESHPQSAKTNGSANLRGV